MKQSPLPAKHIAEISLDTARTISVHAQLLDKRDSQPKAADIIAQLSCIQLDAMQAIRRSQEMVLLARGAKLQECMIEHTYIDLFETWGHAHSLLPFSMWPLFSIYRRSAEKNGHSSDIAPKTIQYVLDRIRTVGPQTLSDLDTAEGKGWERHSPSRWACEWLLRTGVLICTGRDHQWRRIYSLAEDILPPHILAQKLSDKECLDGLIQASIQALGIARLSDIADYFRLAKKTVNEHLSATDYHTVTVEGSPDIWYIDPKIDAEKIQLNTEIVPLSPFDSLIWTRPRQSFLFGKDYRLEAYKPAKDREFGYFGMPLLRENHIIGRVAARKSGSTAIIEALETDFPLSTIEQNTLAETLAHWANCTDIDMKHTKFTHRTNSKS